MESRNQTPVLKRPDQVDKCAGRKQQPRIRAEPVSELVFSLRAWLKLQYLCHVGETEVGGFGLTPPGYPLYVEDVALVRQACTAVSVAFDDTAVADFFDDQVDAGRRPEQFARIWVHTHPGDCPHPSGTDEETFARVFGGCDWAVMFILARGGATYCRLRTNLFRAPATHSLHVERTLGVRIVHADLAAEGFALALEEWRQEHRAAVRPVDFWAGWGDGQRPAPPDAGNVEAMLDWFDALEPGEQQAFLDQTHGNATDPRAGFPDD
jgi:hypothetical protein